MTPFGEYLEKLRRSRHLQQKQLADVMGVNPCYVSSLENGRKGPPSKQILQAMIDKLHLTQDEQEDLWNSVRLSDLTLRLPSNMCRQEFEFVYNLRRNLGRLSEQQLVIMRTALEMGEIMSNAQERINTMYK